MRLITIWLIGIGLIAGWAIHLDGSLAAPAKQDVQDPFSPAPERVRSGLLVLYDFHTTAGATVRDRSGVGRSLDLHITNTKAVRRSHGALEITGKTLIRSEQPAVKIIDPIRKSNEITVEVWIRPASTRLKGPARIVTISSSNTKRNFTLGQDGDRYDARMRTTRTSANGLPSLSSAPKSLKTDSNHVVYTRDRRGTARLYINGKIVSKRTVAGDLANWKQPFHLALANELSNDRPWQGTYYLVAIYNRSLTGGEVSQNHRAGAQATSPPVLLAQGQPSPAAKVFETQIASLLSRHCLECHDTSSKQGGLDLSKKRAALDGGDSGQVIIPGKSSESLLWESVANDEMPSERAPLSAEQKSLLREWIDGGAVWSIDVIDPAVYAHDHRAGDIWVQRLTVQEYIETVRSAVNVDIADDARKTLPPDLRADGFSNTAYNLNVDLAHVDAYATLAEKIVSRMDVLKFAARFSKSRKLTDDSMRGLIAKMGKWLLRGPLEDREITSYRGISTTVASAGGDFEEAVSFIIQAMLQSPRFIYRVENQRGDGTNWPVGDYELASRLSYILWGGPPDNDLMRAADAGELDRAGVERQVRRMLQDPRTIARSSQFIYEWLDLGRLDNLRPNPKRFPNWDSNLSVDMRNETLAFFEDVVWKQNRPLTDLLNAQITFVTPRLADHYAFKSKAMDQAKGEVLARYDLASERGRGGLLTHGSVLTVGGDDASMVTRGLFVLHDVLRGVVQDPPPCVDTTPIPTKAGLTQRGIAEGRIANAACGGCHSKFEPLAFGLEKFDGLGTYHDVDAHGNELRDDGQILFPGSGKPVSYQSSAELMDLLAGSDRVRQCMTWKVAQFALGRPLSAEDAPILEKIDRAAQNGGGTYASLMTAIALSDLVQETRTEQGDEDTSD